jgi:hypothetical protein
MRTLRERASDLMPPQLKEIMEYCELCQIRGPFEGLSDEEWIPPKELLNIAERLCR